MKNDKQALFPWLIDEIYQAKAFIKYDIKQTEIRFHREIMTSWQASSSQKQTAVEFCTALIRLYSELLIVLTSGEPATPELHCLHENDLTRCYLKIQHLKLKAAGMLLLEEEVILAKELLFFYKNLNALLLNESAQTEIVDCQTKNKFLKKMVQAATPEEWLLALVHFANEIGKDSTSYQIQLNYLNNNELQTLNKMLMYPDFIALNNSIFFFKMNPNYLYSETIHLEKLISVKTRLKLLYNFIELLQRFSSQLLRQRGLQAEHDYLFHGEEIPPGINIEVNSGYQPLIIKALKEWRLHYLHLPNESTRVSGYLGELFRAYKFWFNPVSLIDSVMNFYTQVMHHEGDDEPFLTQLSLLYQQLTTTECLDLYGYFSNKDTNYLMRTLLASYQGFNLLSTSTLSDLEARAVYKVYTTLNLVMNALREELKNRHVVTAAYDHRLEDKILKPGRRNLQALQRILDIYCERPLQENKALEQLFSLLED
ncbi:Uncharacterised protein [Legionella beliardensis]|uniref:Uncharacterized protein n=1 Tax=Legionella beliardensis TaxID=91822 RepID=A0A378HZV8_9GAMM|nr:hypothetical protein [Legionella beliardensis]STX27836.1 Uncharacterised protein [Legionella beliardensis]